ncbi:MAG: nitrilase-related carbon-nitrogen hydrolase [Desulfatiglandales bacterium]
MKIGYIQMAPVLGDRDATIRKIDRLMQQGKGADILVLPELCNSGYNFTDRQHAWNASETIDQSIFIQYLVSICRDYGLHIVSGFNEKDGNRLYNAAILVGPHGYLGKYRKLHLFMNEKDYFEHGDIGLPIFTVGSCRVGLLVCFDWIFPEVWRILALKGADIVCHPSNLVLPGLAQKAVPVHALLNRIHIVTANRVGTEGDLTFTGLSTIADHRGNVLLQATEVREEVGIVNVNPELARDKRVTPRNDIFEDRRPDQYRDLIDSL